MLGVQLTLVGKLLRRSRRRGHRNRAPEDETGQPAQAEGPGQDSREHRCCCDLQATHAEHHAPRRDHTRQRELQPDNEHQEGDPEFAEEAHALRRGQEVETVWAHDGAHGEVAYDRRKTSAREQGHGDKRCRHDNQHLV